MAVDPQPWEDLADAAKLLGLILNENSKRWVSFARALRQIYSGPPPLCIDGHEYRRRQRRRSKRK